MICMHSPIPCSTQSEPKRGIGVISVVRLLHDKLRVPVLLPSSLAFAIALYLLFL